MLQTVEPRTTAAPQRVRYVPAVGPRLKKLLFVAFALFALLAVNSAYLVSVTAMEWWRGLTYQNYFYQYMFLMHLALGALIVVPVVVFGFAHMLNARKRSNRRAVRVGYALFTTALVLLGTGFALMRLEAFGVKLEIKNPTARTWAYWGHVVAPLAAMWLFVLHRLAGKRIKWRVGGAWAAVACAFAAAMAGLHSQDPRVWNVAGPKSGEKYFFPSLARTATGNFIPERAMMNDRYCLNCHADVHEKWSHSVHRFASFNNPAYLFSVRNTRAKMFERDGKVNGSRFCAGCHDPVPFFSGAFDDPKFDDPNYDLASDRLAQAGVTCTVCHAITHINTVRGNGDYTIEESTHYPFAYSDNRLLKWINLQLVKAKPAFHKKTFLKPLHKSAEFCGSCHKVHLPEELNAYKFLRGQNHYDAFLLSGVSGHGVTSFYYPPKAETGCNKCHMPLMASDDFGAKFYDDSGELKVHDHQFPSANTAIPHLMGLPAWVGEAHQKFLDGVMRVDIFGIKRGGTIDGELIAPIRPEVPALTAGESYLLETVIRTVKMGHLFTQGTSDSNEVWMDVTVTSGDRVIGRSGGMADDGEVDPWSHFVNAYVIDREGNRIDRRNAEDIFIPLYNHQIGPGAADVVHYGFRVPQDVTEPVTVDVKLKYRKFDTQYVKLFQGAAFDGNDLPVTTLAHDRVTFSIVGGAAATESETKEAPAVVWQRWNDYGIGLLLKGEEGSNKGELRQAEAAFAEVEKLKRPDGPLNRARVYIKEGRLTEAVGALAQAAAFDPPAPPWSVAWFTGLVNKQNGFLDDAIAGFTGLMEMDTEETRSRGFDFSKDYRLINELGEALFERAKQERGDGRRAERERWLQMAADRFRQALDIDPENVTAHYNLSLVYGQLGDEGAAARHRERHAEYKPDDNARGHAVAAARRKSAAANHAAEAVVIYDLQRDGAYGLNGASRRVAFRD
ncbi:MAG: tetratricopeptide repeat protein [Phycisphaerales bacterium]|nr:tetratricopeptide repeat protein [Phycisphaerales bacterium]